MVEDKDGLYLPAGSTAEGDWDLVITPESAGWGYSSLRVITLRPGQRVEFATGQSEWIVLPLTAGVDVTLGEQTVGLAGRDGVFAAVTDTAYLPIDSTVTLTGTRAGEIALCGARADRALPFRYQPASGVDVTLRGSGSHTRQVNNFGMGAGLECVNLLATEVLTPASNWSSYPPHKHDEAGGIDGSETELEEIYYFRFASAAPDSAMSARRAKPIGYQRIYGSADRPIELLEEVTERDTVLVPHGWHGPSIAAPSHHMYYLNVMAGPGAERAWGISDDPNHGWVRATWADRPTDPRLPFYTAPEQEAGDTR
ncbi:5-deoxy-glucuronate isomerase [Nakamurella sp.]|uniref:5-deoxy-glucuronate isomerase n=1 Tax=Nakamurella sp. TaxID=1869182 RepID=UPI0037833DE4